MNGDERTIADLQQRLHEESQRRFQQIEKNQDRQGKQLDELIKNTADLPKLKKDVEEINTERNKFEGAAKLATLMGGGSLLAEGIRWLFYCR